MNKISFYCALGVGIVGTAALAWIHRPELAMGWWAGILIGVLNFVTLLASLRRSYSGAEQEAGRKTRKFQFQFFIRYVALAALFLLVLQWGKQQLGSAILGFLSFYIATLLDYLLRGRLKNNRLGGP